MMNRTLLRVPYRYQQATYTIPTSFSASISRPTFLAFTCNSGRRTLALTSHLRSERPPSTQSTPHELPLSERESPPQKAESTHHIPWYLQEEVPTPASAEITSREQIPEIPEDPPKILPILLDYAFKELGLDDLKLFDLRGLETPPALGANVIMIIGTARSVKHLNVSADRLCRWLRSNWKLTPYADGLLGRNELKIKLRRKARRLRIASRTGTTFDEKDDGITTGWICVNAGVVEKSHVEQRETQGFEGFGAQFDGTRIVVQIFTEEKREEIDLDGLWQANLDRAERQKQRNSGATSNAPEEVRLSNSVYSAPSDFESGHVSRVSVSLPREQRRQLHNGRCLGNLHHANDFRQAPPSEPSSIDSSSNDPNDSGTGVLASSLFQYLSELPDEKVLNELGNGPDDRDSTLFLRLLYDSLSGSTPEEIALAQTELSCMAVSRQHGGYDKEGLFSNFMGCMMSGYDIPDNLASHVVSALLTARLAYDESSGWLPESDKELALQVLEHLILRGAKVMTLDTFRHLYDAASLPTSPGGVANSAAGLSRIKRMIDTLDLPFDHYHARALMISLFQNQDYDGFWKLWRKLPLNNSPRTYDDYQLLFQLHANLGDELRARDCVSTWVPMMNREDPPVPTRGPIIRQIMQCLLLADPEIEQQAIEGSMSHLARLWNECQTRMDD